MFPRWEAAKCSQCGKLAWGESATQKEPPSQNSNWYYGRAAVSWPACPAKSAGPAETRKEALRERSQHAERNAGMSHHTCRRCKLGLEPSEPSGLWAILLAGNLPADCPLTAGELRSLYSRDITPEDYEMLLRLDEVREGETSQQQLALEDCEHLPVPQSHLRWQGETCAVCCSEMLISDDVCGLPCCDHVFHRQCISQWFSSRRAVCPLDNLSVLASLDRSSNSN